MTLCPTWMSPGCPRLARLARTEHTDHRPDIEHILLHSTSLYFTSPSSSDIHAHPHQGSTSNKPRAHPHASNHDTSSIHTAHPDNPTTRLESIDVPCLLVIITVVVVSHPGDQGRLAPSPLLSSPRRQTPDSSLLPRHTTENTSLKGRDRMVTQRRLGRGGRFQGEYRV